MFFLFLAYTQQIKSFWNQNRPRFRLLAKKQVVVDVWMERNSSDFMHHLKFELMQYCLFGSYLFTGMLVMPFTNAFMKYPKYISEEQKDTDVKFNKVNITQMVVNLLQILLLRILLDPINRKNTEENIRKIFCISVNSFIALIAIMTITCFCFVLANWDEIELFQ